MRRAQEDDRLNQRYGKALESEHTGEYVAISDDGRVLLGNNDVALALESVSRFGPGRFALRWIGRDAEMSWRRPLR